MYDNRTWTNRKRHDLNSIHLIHTQSWFQLNRSYAIYGKDLLSEAFSFFIKKKKYYVGLKNAMEIFNKGLQASSNGHIHEGIKIEMEHIND